MSTENHQQKKMKTGNLKIGTHSGTFHADESLAVFMLKLLPKFADAEIIRSRTPEVLDECDIVVDVSGKYDGEKYFDHHQREFEGVFGEGYKTKLSSAGLIYKHFGQDILAAVLKENKESEVVQECFPRIYKNFIEAIDANDNGISVYDPAVIDAINEDDNIPYKLTERFISNTITLPGVVSRCNPRSDELESSTLDENAFYDSRFKTASDIMGSAFLGVVLSNGKDWFPSKTKISHYYNTREDPRVLVLDTSVAWKSHVFDIEKELAVNGTLKDEDKLLYVVFPGGDSWRVQAVPVTSSSFVSRKPLPEAWRGVRDEALSKVTGIDGCVFVHASGFIGGNKTKEGAIAMVKKALEL